MATGRQPHQPEGSPSGAQPAEAVPEGQPQRAARPRQVLDVGEFSRWQDQAASAAGLARLASGAGYYEWACFVAEQAAQVALKGLLHGIGAEAWGHDLSVLAQRAAEALGPLWPAELAGPAVRLSRHYIPARYPDAHPSGPPSAHYLASDADQALDDMEQLMAAVAGAWQSLSAGGP